MILVSGWENFRRSFSCVILNEFLNDEEKKSRQASGFFLRSQCYPILTQKYLLVLGGLEL